MKAPQKVTRKSSSEKARKDKPQDSPTALTIEELAVMKELAGYPFHCPNCSVTFEDVRLFCSRLCKDEAKCVRYARGCIADGRYEGPTVKDGITVKDAIDIKIAWILEGGCKAKAVPESVRRFVIDRVGGRCEICRGPGKDIHHKRPPSNNPAHLQLLCKTCHNEKILARLTSMTEESDPKKWVKWYGLWKRVLAAKPLLCDSERWDSICIWKELMRKRSDAATGHAGLFA
jgi:hypothetical protein